MYFFDGYVCGDISENETTKIKNVKVLDNKIMIIEFTSGEKRLFDATVLKGPAFVPLDDEEVFRNPSIVHGVLTWKNEEIDCSPEYIYKHSYEYHSDDIFVA
jgi:hypothetical protein